MVVLLAGVLGFILGLLVSHYAHRRIFSRWAEAWGRLNGEVQSILEDLVKLQRERRLERKNERG